MLNEKAVSKKQQRFFGMVRAAQKGEMENPSPEVAKAASSMSKSDVKDFAKTKHDKLPERKKVEEGNKSGDSSLRDWFSKSRSSDGTPGWVQLGGKYAGKPCAKQPGQTTKPKCGSSKMKRDLNKDEEERAFRRKNAEDPNPDRRGKAKNVATEEFEIEEGMTLKDYKKKRSALKQKEKRAADKIAPGRRAGIHADKASPERAARHRANVDPDDDRGAASDERNYPGGKLKNPKKIRKAKALGELGEAAGEKDACYHKVKSRYKVWPSAYASGALVKCRKKGAKNWGNKTKKEGMSFSDFREISEARGTCWKGYKQVGMKKKGGKMVPNCVPEEVTNEAAAWTRKAGKNSEGGLNEKGRKSYERENPGSDLKRPSKKVGNPRRKSFCARMKGMKKKLTSKKTASDPDSRINKSLRAWNC